MIQTLEIKLVVPDGVRLPQSACSLLHGVLMAQIDETYAEMMHQNSLRPYSQFLHFDKNRNALYWRITSLNEQAKNEILDAAFSLPQKVFLKQKNVEIELLGKEFLPATGYGSLAEKYFTHPLAGRYVSFDFFTSCSFKSEGQYVIFPQPNFLLGSLVKRWNAFADSNKLEAPGVAQDLAQEVYVADYRLRMQAFSVDGARIPAFRGDYTLGMKNNLMSNRIIAMLSDYANYCGIGIKTALGMGAVRTSLKGRFY